MKDEGLTIKKPLTTYGEPLDSVLKDLCEAINVDYTTVDFTENDWFLKHTWSFEDHINFKNQLIKKIKKNKKFYSSLINVTTDRNINHSVEMFLFTYGWKFNKEN
jgi:hypothetical protein